MKSKKYYRVLYLYVHLVKGESINGIFAANEFGVNERTIQRDIADIRAFLANEMALTGIRGQIKFDRKEDSYILTDEM